MNDRALVAFLSILEEDVRRLKYEVAQLQARITELEGKNIGPSRQPRGNPWGM